MTRAVDGSFDCFVAAKTGNFDDHV
jgi:hypothetical protein